MYQLIKVSTLNNSISDAEIVLSWPDSIKTLDILSYAEYCNKGAQANYNNKYTDIVYTFFVLKDVKLHIIESSGNLDLYERRVRGE